ncbi:MAG: glutathione synthase [Candidatus Cloacimonetes bacterium 4572_55]|nr:MAG: glutathione synthase [Candidatus Cloacimonetes bacterium 4572_55]
MEKKIGILFGQEDTFPQAFVDRVNSKEIEGITAEFVRIDKVLQAQPSEYAVVIDRISQDIPFYRTTLKNMAISGTAVINNPFWWTADDKFFNNALAEKIGVAVPKTVVLPSKEHPPDTNEKSMRNLAYPLDWDTIFGYVGFPAYFKPFSGGGWKNVYRVESPEALFQIYNETGQLVMMLQEEINFTEYFRCYCIDRRDVHIMRYDPRQPHHLRYVRDPKPISRRMTASIRRAVLDLNKALGYDFNTVELALQDGVLYAIDFCNPAPDADLHSVGPENFEWVVEAVANMAIRRAKNHKPERNNMAWGDFVRSFVNKKPLVPLPPSKKSKKPRKKSRKKSVQETSEK